MASQYINLSDNINIAFDKINENFEALDSSLSNLAGLDVIQVDDSISLSDNKTITFGTGNDLKIYHNGSNSMIQDNGIGNIILQSVNGNGVTFRGTLATDKMAEFKTDNAVELFYNNAKKFSTAIDGITVTGKVSADSGDITTITSNLITSSNAKFTTTNVTFDNGFSLKGTANFGDSDQLQISTSLATSEIESSKMFIIKSDSISLRSSVGVQTLISDTNNIELLYNGIKKLETTLAGVTVTGDLTATTVDAAISNENASGSAIKFWTGTQAEYDAITTYDPATMYLIK